MYDVLCKLTQKRIRFFEFPYFVLVSLLYLFIFLVWPFLIGLIPLQGGVPGIFGDQNLTMFVLFGGGAGLVAAAVSGFDIYPVNVFRTKDSLQHLITITRDLMRFSNRLLALVTGAVVVGWAFKKVELSLDIVYITAYGVIGFALGSTAALGSRVTGLLYALCELDNGQEPEQAPDVENSSED